jgi:uncharacterized protein (DUF2235 family)
MLPEQVDIEGAKFGKVAYYVPGVGSRLHGTAGILAKLHGMATGALNDVSDRISSKIFSVHTVVTAYSYIAECYKPGDRIW